MIVLEEISKRLAEAIKKSGLTQQAIAEKLGVCQQTISSYVRGDKIPSLDTFAKLCGILKLDVNEILCIK